MAALTFQKATKLASKGRIALLGPSGSGKTFTALAIATALGKRIAFIDTEEGSARKYSDLFDFDVLELTNYNPQHYIDAIHAAESAGYDVIIVDSLSHAWIGEGGALELVEKAGRRGGGENGNKFAGWKDVTPLQRSMVKALTGCKAHVIVTMRVKMEYVQEKDEKGKTVVRKVGLQPVQRDGLEYEFDVVCDLDTDNWLMVGKTRCHLLHGYQKQRAGKEFADTYRQWLEAGDPAPAPAPAPERLAPTETNGHGDGQGQTANERTIAAKNLFERAQGMIHKTRTLTAADWGAYLKEAHRVDRVSALSLDQIIIASEWLDQCERASNPPGPEA